MSNIDKVRIVVVGDSGKQLVLIFVVYVIRNRVKCCQKLFRDKQFLIYLFYSLHSTTHTFPYDISRIRKFFLYTVVLFTSLG